jgi:AsmA protein
MKTLKIIFYILCLIILIAVLAFGSLAIFVDPNKLKPMLVEEVRKQTGYKLVIDGKLSWSFYPRVAVKIDRMTLTPPNQTVPFIDAQDVRIGADVAQLIHSNEKLQGNVSISNVKLTNIHAENVSADLHWQNNALIIEPIKASFYGGTLVGTATGSNFSAVQHWKWNIQANGIQIKPLLDDANDGNSKIKIAGVGQMNMQAESSGKTREQVLNSLNGTLTFSIRDGVVEGIDLNYLFQSADALINKQPMPSPTNINETVFQSLQGTAAIKNGVAETNDMLLTSSAFTTKAQGSVELLSQSINLRLQLNPQQKAKTQWEIPVLITGRLNHPDIRLDTEEIQKFLAAQEIEKLKAKAVEQIQKRIPGKAGEFLQNLLGN